MIVLGVDPGTRVTGYGVLDGSASTPRVIAAGVVNLAALPTLPRKLLKLHEALEQLILQYKPDEGAVETQFHGVNARSAFLVGQARGIVLFTFEERGLPCGEYTPATVKKTVAGHGRATKEQILRMIATLTRTKLPPGSHDAADAVGIAYTHLQRRRPLRGI
ncbi:MAG: crossover junction endodeoxyribonuclease RuvC [Planctomycetota bacterium]